MPETMPHKFKVGDRVMVDSVTSSTSYTAYNGCFGAVTRIGGPDDPWPYDVLLDGRAPDDDLAFSEEELVSISSVPTLVALAVSPPDWGATKDAWVERVLSEDPPFIREVDRHPNSARFHRLLEEAGALHDKKQADYGRGDDPFANVRGSTEWGMSGWVGAMVRANDKIKRLQQYARKGTLANEGVMDAFMDLAVYALIAAVLWEEEQA